MSALTAFSWGYWGWGNATAELITEVDAAERARGFALPMFVDARIRRSGRAIGFIGDAFERKLGPGRYRHLAGLGNRNVAEGGRPGITIDRPEDATRLLALSEESDRRNSRAIFFCSCQFAHTPEGDPCHRTDVARLLLAEAARAGIDMTCVEWPAGSPEHITLDVAPNELRAVRTGRKSLALGKHLSLAHAAALGHGSTATLRSGDHSLEVGTGPAIFSGGQWCLPMHPLADGSTWAQWSAKWVREHGFAPHFSLARAASEARTDFPLCIYSIAHRDLLTAIAERGGAGSITERRAWTTGQKHLNAARSKRQDLALLLGDATDCSRILYHATVRDIAIEGEQTRVTFSDLRPIPTRRTPQELVLDSTGRNIAPDFIRPYAICRTPKWLSSLR
jgi:hypothetical protein